ncbi:MAG: hypothetical protein ABIV25_03660, partial [Paracoccaceae bacterium]
NAWRAAWRGAGLEGEKAGEMDAVLHQSRVADDQRQRRFMRDASGLPDGAFVWHEGQACLVHRGRLHPYRTAGYDAPYELPEGLVEVMTPKPTVAVLLAGFRPALHPSASGAVAEG